MQLMAAWGPLIYAGCFAATLSTALTNLLSVPRLIQALGRDRIYPGNEKVMLVLVICKLVTHFFPLSRIDILFERLR